MAFKSPFLHLLFFIFLLSIALLALHFLQNLSRSVRFDRILAENNGSGSLDSAFAPAPNSPISSDSSAAINSSRSSNSSLATALFVFGDSSADCGSGIINRWLPDRADHWPYGRDFDTHWPTGRFCNGRIIVDFLALRLGLPFVPAWLPHYRDVEDIIHGMNFASAGGGILSYEGLNMGIRPFTQQTGLFAQTFQQIEMKLGQEKTMDIISKSVFYLSIGSNDFIQYLLQDASGIQSRYQPWEFNQVLVRSMQSELKSFYDVNARKLVVMGVGPLGCAPYFLARYNRGNRECVDEINNMIIEFNFAMRFMISNLNQKLPQAKITFCDTFEGFMDIVNKKQNSGLETTTDACCGSGRYGGWFRCTPESACENASTHVWWDRFHPTDAVNAILADNVWSGLHAKICYPMCLKDMVQ